MPPEAVTPGRIVLLTRPEPDSRDVARELAAHVIETAIWPLTTIVQKRGPFTIPQDTDGLVFTSHNGVTAMAGTELPADIIVWCVGNRTADAARTVGFRNVISAGGDIDDLVGLLSAQPPLRLVYPRARHVSADLAALLRGAGHTLISTVVYEAVPAGPPPPDISALLTTGRIGVIALWSRRSARVLAEQIADNPDWHMSQTTAVVISARAAEPLQNTPVADIAVAQHPDGPAMISEILVAVRQ